MPLEKPPLLFAQAPSPIGVRFSPADVRTTSAGDSEFRSSFTAWIPRSFVGNSYHFPDTRAAAGAEGLPAGILTARLASLACSAFRAAGSSRRGLAFIAGSSLSHTRFITDCMLRTPLVIATTASCSGITMQYWPKAPSPRYALWRQRQNW